MISGIYGIRNKFDGKIYIGSSKDMLRRKASHFLALGKLRHHSRHLQFSFKRDGIEAFTFEILELVEDLIFLYAREQFWIWRTRSSEPAFGYNIVDRPDGPHGYRHTDEAKARIGKASEGNKHRLGIPNSIAARAKIGAATRGRKHSKATIAKMSAKMLGRKPTPEMVARCRATKIANGTLHKPTFAGRAHTLETRAKISASKIGKSNALKGRPKTAEHKAALSLAKKGKMPSEEHMRKLREGRARKWAAYYEGIREGAEQG